MTKKSVVIVNGVSPGLGGAVARWHVDGHQKAKVPDSHRVVVSVSKTIGDNMMAFVRFEWLYAEAPSTTRQ